jgi:asparagine synthase (glutamine-hydrolysing)
MSGIFGIIHRDGRPDNTADLERMRDDMAHRGPDGSDIWLDGSAGLGQLMLCATPESRNEPHPLKDSESGLVITADARIDNREELFAKLNGSSSRMNPLLRVPDSQVILEAYKRWGEGCVDHLLGDFAFAIWDAREKRLFCARDHMGIRPFYYYLDDKLFVFASSALGVVSSGLMPRKVNEERIADYLVFELEGADKTSSWFQGVHRLPPATTITLSRSGFLVSEYWKPGAGPELTLSSDEAYVEALEEVLNHAIRARLRSHKPVASMLSGGVDSSVIAGISRKLLSSQSRGQFPTFSGVSEDGEECRESFFSRQLVSQGGLNATLLKPSDVSRFEESILKVDAVMEDPFDAAWILHKMIYLSAKKNGHVAVMDGIDGDGVASLTTSYPLFLMRSGRFLEAHREMIGLRRKTHCDNYPMWREYSDALRALLIPRFASRLKRRLLRSDFKEIDKGYLVSRDFVARLRLPERLSRYRDEVAVSGCRSLREAHIKRMGVPYLTAGVERYNRLGSICGVEQRAPLLDKRVVEFCISLPWQLKVRHGWNKYALRLLAEKLVPGEIAWRTGSERINWKFWKAWYAMNQFKGKPVGIQDFGSLAECLDKQKFFGRLSQAESDNLEAIELIQNIIYLKSWIERNCG